MRNFIIDFLRDKTKICPKTLNKKIKEVTISSCPPKTNKQFLYSKISFDIEGNKTEFKTYQSGKLITWEKYTYQDNKLNEILAGKSKWKLGSYNEKDFEFFPKPVTFVKEPGIVELNEKGQKIISTFFLSGQLESRKSFNENNLCIDVTEFSIKNTITYKETYNSAGQLLEARRYKSDGTPLNYTINTYDDQSRLSRSVSVSRTGHLTHDTVLKYNENVLLLETVGHPDDPENAFADLKDKLSEYSHKYFYVNDNLLDTDALYLCGDLIMSYKHSYQLW